MTAAFRPYSDAGDIWPDNQVMALVPTADAPVVPALVVPHPGVAHSFPNLNSFNVRFDFVAPIYGDNNPNVLTGSWTDDVIYGLGGNDWLYGGAGFDLLFGGNGNDVLSPGDDFYGDYIDGGAGNDTITYASNSEGVAFQLGGSSDASVAVEAVGGSGFNDTLSGDNYDNSIFGQDGDDILSGRGATTAFSEITAMTA